MFGFSPDAVLDNCYLLEVKCPTAGKSFAGDALLSKLKYLVYDGNKYVLKRTHTYYTQIQLGLMILNLKAAKLVIFFNVKKKKMKELLSSQYFVMITFVILYRVL